MENGVIRIASQPRYPHCFGSTAAARAAVINFVNEMKMERCQNEITLLDDTVLVNPSLLSPSRVADLYLLALAVANNARLATFDRRIQPVAINGGKEALEIIPVS